MTDSPLSNPLPHPILLETDHLPPGFVNSDCSFIVEGGKRFILLKGIVVFAYDLVDSASERMLLIQLHLQGSASLADIHRASGILSAVTQSAPPVVTSKCTTFWDRTSS